MPDTWLVPPETTTLPVTAVDVYRVYLDRDEGEVARLRAVMASEEQARADRFHFERDRRRFTVARGVLRTILGRYLAAPAADIEFGYGDHGKPYLTNDPSLHFNISHSHAWALMAFTRHRCLGVDIEFMRQLDDAEEIARRFFSADESALFCSLPASQQHEAFFNCWTRKEAFIKAIGEGLSHPLDTFDVTFVPGETARLLRVVDGEPQAWDLRPLFPAAQYKAAIIVDDHDWELRCWHWPG